MTLNLNGGSSIILAETIVESDHKSLNKKYQLHKNSEEPIYSAQRKDAPKERQFQIIWLNTILLMFLHIGALYGMYLLFKKTKLVTFIFSYILTLMGGMGVTAGAHRLWSHRSYKANFRLRLILAYLQTMTFQKSIYEWVRDHRVHHKFNDTDADPHNPKRGFFFSHVGWLMVKKHKDVITKGATVDLSDLLRDPIVVFQRKYYYWIAPIVSFLIPAMIPYYFFNEPLDVAFYCCVLLRYTIFLNITWLINSAAHIWGNKPYDKNSSATDCLITALESFGEGWHNYHHVFPWDYKAAELGNYHINFTTAFIDFFAKIGWAYDLKTVSNEMIEKRVKRTGDGSHSSSIKNQSNINEEMTEDLFNPKVVWGWEDKDMSQELRDEAKIMHAHEKEI